MSNSWMLFVDTNIYLDFYRQPGGSVKRQLESLERHVDRLIIGDQVRMEFLKNRQKVILKALSELKKPTGATGIPQVFSGLQAAKSMMKHQKSALDRFADLRAKGESMLEDPTHNDPIFVSFNRLFSKKTSLNLARPKKERLVVRSKARKRFSLGYPPRKSGDTSIGDAINWEWILHCAIEDENKSDILIVSRDGDYGISTDSGVYLNDWLHREFKERVSKKRKIELTDKLTDALKKLDERVAPEDSSAEESILQEDKAMKVRDTALGASEISEIRSRVREYMQQIDPEKLEQIRDAYSAYLRAFPSARRDD